MRAVKRSDLIPALPLRVYWKFLGVAAALVISLAPAPAAGQGGTRADSLAYPGIRVPRSWAPRVPFVPPAAFTRFGLAVRRGDPSSVIAAAEAAALQRALEDSRREIWRVSMVRARAAGVTTQAVGVALPLLDPMLNQRADSGIAGLVGNLLADDSPIGMSLAAKFETKVDRTRNERCTASQFFAITSQCSAGFTPDFDLQFQIRAGGSIADRLHINVDYDSQREFKSSDNINIFYQGKSDEWIEKLEVGNVGLQLPPSQFITSGIPSGNYGIQAIGQLGPMKYRAIVAQQQGNVPKSYEVVVGDRTVKPDNRDIEDYQVEARRFFFTVDPKLFGAAYPNVDILNAVQMRAIAEALPETARPRRLFVYKLLIGGQPKNPNGPRFEIIGNTDFRAGPVYELLQENKDYYTDPSLLWIALQGQLNLQNERLVVAYTLRIGGRDTVIAELGGTPDVSYVPDRPQLAHLLWDPQLKPADPAFQHEIRSVYRVAGEDLRRQSVSLRILTGGGAGQEKPLAGTADTYLQMFGLAQSGNAALFDIENRLWPRPSDPNVSVGIGAANAKIIRDYFLVLPSIRPFAANGLVQAGNPVSDTVYVTAGEDLYSQQHPPSHYRLQFHYDIEGGGNVGTLALGAVQLRRSSEIVLVDGVPLVRGDDKDYTIDYEIGMITFTRPDTLFMRPRRVSVRYEENPLFAAAPTSILGFAAQFPLERGEFGFTMISQRQSTAFTRPPLGYEPQSSFIAGVTGRFGFEASPLSRLIEKWPTIRNTTLSHINVQGEFATSRPQPNSAGAAYLESFENEGAIAVPVQEAAWHYSSQPALGARLGPRLGDETFSLSRATTMAWQGAGLSRAGIPIQFTLSQIDPQVALSGTGVSAPEAMLWLTLYPLSVGGLLSDSTGQFQWKVDNTPTGLRWRSLVAGLGPSGADLSRTEYITFWTLADTTAARRATNPRLVIDLGDPSENSVAFGPSELTITPGVVDSAYRGKSLMGFDILNSERDSLSRSFNQAVNDTGLPGDVIPFLNVFKGDSFDAIENFTTCARGAYRILLLGDARNNCTVKNGRLDEEDVDFDNVLNLTSGQREQERVRRYIVDLANPSSYTRVGKCSVAAFDTVAGGTVVATDLCWVRVQVPFRAPDDSLNGGPNVRRIRAIRLTMVSGDGAADAAFTQLPLALFKFEGSPLIKRSDRTVSGIAGDQASQGFVISSVIGTQDRDSLRNVDYESPPGVTDQAERQQTGLEQVQTTINERSLRLLAGRLAPYERAESFLRFPEGIRNFMSYKELRVWARGRGNGWGQNSELQFYIKIGRDANNFYLYRTSISAGQGQAAWLPEIRVDFNRLFELQTQMRNSIFQAGADSLACTGVDSILIARSGIPIGQPVNRHAACRDGYIIYSLDPAVNPPSLAQVQELAVGIVRVADGVGPSPIALSDTLELWVDDIRLTDVENTPGYAGQFGLNVQAGDVANFTASVSRRDAYFRQLSEAPSFLGNDGLSFATNIRLERLLPRASSYSLPLSITHTEGSSQPLFLSQSDVLAAGINQLRTPQNSVTRYGVTMRRAAPMSGTPWAVIVNNLTANANYLRSQSRSEFSDGGSRNWNVGLDYNLQTPNARYTKLPRWMGGGERTLLRWNPSQVRFATDLGQLSDNRLSFSKPVAVAGDSGRRVTGLSHLLRAQSFIEFRPVPSVTANWSFAAVRDLRDYGDTSATSIIASAERQRFLGMNAGLERERQMNAAFRFEPTLAAYFHPTLSFVTSYAAQRDPQTRQLVRTGDSTGAFALPRRVTNFQTLAATSYFDPARALKKWFGEEGRRERIFDRFQALDLAYSRTLTSSFDGAAFDPGLAYQFALGGVRNFLETEDHRASIAGATDQLTLNTGLKLKNDLNLTTRAQFQNSDNYTRRLDNTQALIQGHQETWPSVGLGWRDSLPWLKNWEPFGKDKGKPFRWLRVASTVGANVTIENTRNVTLSPGETAGAPDDRRIFFTRHHQLGTSINWRDPGGLFTQFSFDSRWRTDSVPGSVTETRAKEMSVDVQRAFRIPQSWVKLPGRVRTHVSWVHSTASSYISVQNAAKPSRLADNGRTIISLNADTDVMPRVKFSLNGSRVVTFDNNYNRKLSQFVLAAIFQLQYEIGNIGNMR